MEIRLQSRVVPRLKFYTRGFGFVTSPVVEEVRLQSKVATRVKLTSGVTSG